MACAKYQIDRIWNHLGDKSPGTLVMNFLASGYVCDELHCSCYLRVRNLTSNWIAPSSWVGC